MQVSAALFVSALALNLCAFSLLPVLKMLPGAAVRAAEARLEPMRVQSPDFAAGALIPKKYSADGADQSPAMVWSKAPTRAQSLVITCTDPDAPRGVWWHWIVFNVPADAVELKGGQARSATLAGGVCQGTNDFGNVGYNGPAPPSGPVHHYHFAVYALDTKLALKGGCSKAELNAAMHGHVVAGGEYVGTYVRR
ncbi:MAG: YbhB/YbcL family Raf kinase inhibitor-like protein [Cyanobacteria bacterium REEB67]|nr:YbhB/YbcL family Raf kinase inhibitor-like protein [Cyanobacteria bacterium REEB67]